FCASLFSFCMFWLLHRLKCNHSAFIFLLLSAVGQVRSCKAVILQEWKHCHRHSENFPAQRPVFCRQRGRNRSKYATERVCHFRCENAPACVLPEKLRNYCTMKFHDKCFVRATRPRYHRFSPRRNPYHPCIVRQPGRAVPVSAISFPHCRPILPVRRKIG